MNFNFLLLRSLRILLFPLSLVYYVIIWLRNKLYDTNILHSATFNLPLICVGNLSVGGTGKSPMVEYLVQLLQGKYQVATLSRGYKRKTKGYALANAYTTALEIGDEPMQFHIKFPNCSVAVGEQRLEAIPQLLHDKPDTEVIILDDAFQHRQIKAGLNIILTDYSNLYTRDWYLPTGDLRDQRMSSRRADIIVVTKCPTTMNLGESLEIKSELNPLPQQHVFFTTIAYGLPYHILLKNTITLPANTEVLLVTGIANPMPIKQMLQNTVAVYDEIRYGDHHIFTIDDLREIKKQFEERKTANKIILTTEKDAVRLIKFQKELEELPMYVMPIQQKILLNGQEAFDSLITTYVQSKESF